MAAMNDELEKLKNNNKNIHGKKKPLPGQFGQALPLLMQTRVRSHKAQHSLKTVHLQLVHKRIMKIIRIPIIQKLKGDSNIIYHGTQQKISLKRKNIKSL